MSKPTVKKITKNQLDEATDDADTCVYYLNYNEDKTQITLMVSAKRPINPHEYMDALASFVNDVSESPDSLFVEDVDN